MIYLKDNPVGIDLKIQRIQERLYRKMVDNYNCDIVSYGRIYRDTDDNGVSKLLFCKGGNEYDYILIDDTIKGLHFFFVESDNSDIESNSCFSSTDVDIIVIINDITKVKTSVNHYADEEIKEDVKYWVKSQLDLNKSVKGINSLDGFDVSKLKFRHPFFVFKITGNINNY